MYENGCGLYWSHDAIEWAGRHQVVLLARDGNETGGRIAWCRDSILSKTCLHLCQLLCLESGCVHACL